MSFKNFYECDICGERSPPNRGFDRPKDWTKLMYSTRPSEHDTADTNVTLDLCFGCAVKFFDLVSPPK